MTGAKQLMQAQTLVANNLANASTPGFRADLASFRASPVAGSGYPSRVNTVADGAGFDHAPGTLVSTGAPLDIAIDGEGWIAVQARDGSEAYTRAGSLRLNPLGLLETQRGELVLAPTVRFRFRRTCSCRSAATARSRSCRKGKGRRRSHRSGASSS